MASSKVEVIAVNASLHHCYGKERRATNIACQSDKGVCSCSSPASFRGQTQSSQWHHMTFETLVLLIVVSVSSL